MPTMMVRSATLRRLRRDLDNSRRLAVAPAGGVAKRSSPPHLSSPPQRCSAPSSPAPRSGAYDTPRERARPSLASSAPRSGHAAASAGAILKKSSLPSLSESTMRSLRRERVQSPLRSSSAASESISKGAQVRVRTPVGKLPTGQRLVLWLSAVVVSAAEEGYLEVVYNGNFPRDDPFRTVRVAKDQVKKMSHADAAAVSDTYTTAPPRPARYKVALRPTVAGKSLPVLKRLEKEMRGSSEAIMVSW